MSRWAAAILLTIFSSTELLVAVKIDAHGHFDGWFFLFALCTFMNFVLVATQFGKAKE